MNEYASDTIASNKLTRSISVSFEVFVTQGYVFWICFYCSLKYEKSIIQNHKISNILGEEKPRPPMKRTNSQTDGIGSHDYDWYPGRVDPYVMVVLMQL